MKRGKNIMKERKGRRKEGKEEEHNEGKTL